MIKNKVFNQIFSL